MVLDYVDWGVLNVLVHYCHDNMTTLVLGAWYLFNMQLPLNILKAQYFLTWTVSGTGNVFVWHKYTIQGRWAPVWDLTKTTLCTTHENWRFFCSSSHSILHRRKTNIPSLVSHRACCSIWIKGRKYNLFWSPLAVLIEAQTTARMPATDTLAPASACVWLENKNGKNPRTRIPVAVQGSQCSAEEMWTPTTILVAVLFPKLPKWWSNE